MTMEASLSGSNDNGIAFLVAAGIVHEIIAKDCSSPQTMEINAEVRAPTLMKWVTVGVVESAVFVCIAAIYTPSNAGPIFLGGILAGSITYLEYVYAKKKGLEDRDKPGTESW